MYASPLILLERSWDPAAVILYYIHARAQSWQLNGALQTSSVY